MKKMNLLKKAFLGFLCTGIAGVFSVTTWSQQPTVTVSGGTVVVPGTGGDVSLNIVGNGGVVTMSDPGSGNFTIISNGTNLLTWSLSGDLSFDDYPTAIKQSIPATTSATTIYSFNKNPRQAEINSPSSIHLARSKGRVYISYDATCSGGISFDVYKTYSNASGAGNEYVPPIIGPECWLPDSTYTYSVDQIASDNLSDGIGIDEYYWKIEDKNGVLIYSSEALPSLYPNSYTSADKSSITTKVPTTLESPYTITCCFGRANQWDGNNPLSTHTTCVTKTIGANPIPPSFIITDKCLDVLASSFTIGVSFFNPTYTYNWSSNNSQWLITPNPGGGATVTGTYLNGGGIISLEVENNGCSSVIVRDTVNRRFSDTVSIAGETCVSSGSTHNYQLRPSEVQANMTDWVLPYGWTYNNVNGTHSDINITIPGGTPGGTYTLKAYARACDEDTVYLTVRVRPENPQKESGNRCLDYGSTTAETYTVSPAGEYLWIIPAGWTGSSNTETITLTPNGTDAGRVIAIGRDTSGMGCNSLDSAIWNVDFKPIEPVATVGCINVGINGNTSVTISNPPLSTLPAPALIGNYEVSSVPGDLLTGYTVNTSTGQITLHTSGAASGTNYTLNFVHKTTCGVSDTLKVPVTYGSSSQLTLTPFPDEDFYRISPAVPGATGYQWFLDGNSIVNPGPSLSLYGTGTPPVTVCVEVTTSNGCIIRLCRPGGAFSEFILGNENAESTATGNISVSPNPNAGEFTILVEKVENQASLTIIDMKGTVVSEGQSLTRGMNRITTRQLTKGLYILLITVDGNTHAQKVEIID